MNGDGIRQIEAAFPILFHMVGGYFHQDWDVHASSFEDVVALIKNDYSSEGLILALAELDRAIEDWRGLNEEALNFNVERGLGCDYNYAYFGLTGIEFLEKLRDQLRA